MAHVNDMLAVVCHTFLHEDNEESNIAPIASKPHVFAKLNNYMMGYM
jgi:hypothetical protein